MRQFFNLMNIDRKKSNVFNENNKSIAEFCGQNFYAQKS